MKRYVIQFNNRTITLVEGHIERMMFLFLMIILGFSFFLYLVFVGQTIVNIVERKNIENENRVLSSRVNKLELSYLSETNKIDLALAYSLGFQDSKNTVFAPASSSGKPLSFARNN